MYISRFRQFQEINFSQKFSKSLRWQRSTGTFCFSTTNVRLSEPELEMRADSRKFGSVRAGTGSRSRETAPAIADVCFRAIGLPQSRMGAEWTGLQTPQLLDSVNIWLNPKPKTVQNPRIFQENWLETYLQAIISIRLDFDCNKKCCPGCQLPARTTTLGFGQYLADSEAENCPKPKFY